MSTVRRDEIFLDALLSVAAWVLGFVFLYYPMSSTPLVPGIDGPYYIVQVKHLLERGGMKYPDPPLAFYIMALVTILCRDVFTAVELTSSAVTALTALPTYALIKRLSKSKTAAFAAALTVSITPFTIRLASDFMKNSMGLLWLALFLYFNTSYIERGERKFLLGALVSLALTALTHILDYGVAILYAALFFLLTRGDKRKWALPGALAAVISLLAFMLAPFVVGGDVWKGIAFLEELAEGGEVTVIRPDWLALSVGVSASLIVASFYLKDSPLLALLSAASGAVGIILNLPVIPPKWLFRFRLMTVVPLAHGMGVAVAAVRERYRPIVAVLLLALVASMGFEAYRAVRPSIPPPAYAELKTALRVLEAKGLQAVVPDVRLRYWAETIGEVYKNPQEANGPYAIVALKSGRRVPRGVPVFEGRFIIAVVHHTSPWRRKP